MLGKNARPQQDLPLANRRARGAPRRPGRPFFRPVPAAPAVLAVSALPSRSSSRPPSRSSESRVLPLGFCIALGFCPGSASRPLRLGPSSSCIPPVTVALRSPG